MIATATEFHFRSDHEKKTEQLATALAQAMQPGSVVTLDGDLGAGKTRFAQAVAKALGVKETVNSPTFTIIKEYQGRSLPLYHMDVYRISLEEADELGLDEYFYGDGVCLVEWARRIEELLPAERLEIYIAGSGDEERRMTLTPHGEPYHQWCTSLKENGLIS